MVIVLCQWDWNGDCVVSVGLKRWLCCVSGTEMVIVLRQRDWNGDCVVSVGLKWTNIKIGKIVSVYQREMFKKIAGLYPVSKRRVKSDMTHYQDINRNKWKGLRRLVVWILFVFKLATDDQQCTNIHVVCLKSSVNGTRKQTTQINFIGLQNNRHPSQHTAGNVHKDSGNCQ
jgi:hypothetical protein